MTGELLLEKFPEADGCLPISTGQGIGVPPQRIGEIAAGKRAVTVDTDLRLAACGGRSESRAIAAATQLISDRMHD